MDSLRLFWECSKCGQKDSYLLDSSIALQMANGGCPHCGQPLNVEPNCHICKHRHQIIEFCMDCKSMDKYEQDRSEA